MRRRQLPRESERLCLVSSTRQPRIRPSSDHATSRAEKRRPSALALQNLIAPTPSALDELKYARIATHGALAATSQRDSVAARVRISRVRVRSARDVFLSRRANEERTGCGGSTRLSLWTRRDVLRWMRAINLLFTSAGLRAETTPREEHDKACRKVLANSPASATLRNPRNG